MMSDEEFVATLLWMAERASEYHKFNEIVEHYEDEE